MGGGPQLETPDFLLIGAMKAGTTSLYRDLDASPEVFFPADKEPGDLADPAVLGAAGRRAYARRFRAARPGQRRGDASTIYSKAPDVTGVADRALAVCGPDLRVVYLVRDPVARVVSHYHHELVAGELPPMPLEQALDRHPALLDYTRYMLQLSPWLHAFGADAVHVVRFEDYVADRRTTVAGLAAFLGIADHSDRLHADAVHNRSAGKPVTTPGWRRLTRSPLYRSTVRRVLSPTLRHRLRTLVLPTAPPPPAVPDAVAARIRAELAEDHAALARWLGRPEPLWPDADPAA